MSLNDILSGLTSNPSDTRAFEALNELLLGEKRYDELREHYDNLICKASDQAVKENLLKSLDMMMRKTVDEEKQDFLCHSLAKIYRRENDLVKSEFYYRKIAGKLNFAEEAREFYVDFYAARGNWLRLEQFLSEEAQKTGIEDQYAIKKKLAETALKYGNRDKALSYFQAVYSIKPDDKAVEETLMELYSAGEKWHSLAELLKEKVRRVERKEEKIALLLKMVEIFRDKLKAEPKVIATYNSILEIDPSHLESLNTLQDYFEKTNRWPDLIKILQKKSGVLTGRELTALYEYMAAIYLDKFSNAAEAIKCYESVLALEHDRLDIIAKLKEIYDKRRDFESYINVSLRELEFISSVQEKIDFLSVLASAATEKLRKIPLSIDLYSRIVALDENNLNALKNLEILHEREKNYPELVTILKKRIDIAESNEEKVLLLEKLAIVYSVRLNELDAASAVWRELLEINPLHDRAKRELKNRYLQLRDFEAIEWFFRRFQSVDELARTMEGMIATIAEAETKKRVLFRLASIWRDELGQHARAVKDLEMVLSIEPENVDAANQLIPLYRELAEWRKLPAVYDIAIASADNPARKCALILEIAKIQEENLNNKEKAFFWLVEAFKENFEDRSIRKELERLAEPTNNYDIYVAVLEEVAQRLASVEDRIEVFIRIGQICSEKLNQIENAVVAFRSALELDEVNRDALNALEGIYRAAGRHVELVEVLRKKLAIEGRDEFRREILFDIGCTLRDHLREYDQAISLFNEMLELYPTVERVYDELGAIYSLKKDFGLLKELVRRELNTFAASIDTPPSLLCELNTRLGMLEYETGGSAEVVVSLYRDALLLNPGYAPAAQLLEELIEIDEVRGEIIPVLKQFYLHKGDAARLADITELELRDRGDSRETLSLLRELLSIYRGMDGADEFIYRTLCRIFRTAPEREEVWGELEASAEKLYRLAELVTMFEAESGAIEDQPVRIKLLLKTAEIYNRKLHNMDEAVQVYNQVLKIEDSNENALDELEALYESKEEWANLIEIFRKKIAYSPYAGVQIDYSFRMAQVFREKLNDLENAVASVLKILNIEPENEFAYRRLDDLYSELKNYAELEKVILERIRLSEDEPEQQMKLYSRLALLRETELGNPAGAVEVYRTMLTKFPSDDTALVNLERFFAEGKEKRSAATLLRPVYERSEEFAKLVDVYTVLAEAEEYPAEKVNYYNKIKEIHETKLSRFEDAFNAAAMAFRVAPEREDLITEVLRTAERVSMTEDAIFVLIEKVADIADETRRKETHRTIARTVMAGGFDKEIALKNFTEILLIDPSDAESVDSLIEIYRERSEYEPLVALIQNKVELTADPLEKCALLKEASTIYENNLKNIEKAIETLTWALDIYPAFKEALTSLERLYEETGSYDNLVNILSRRYELAETNEERIHILKKKGDILFKELENLSEAVESFRIVLGLNPLDIEALRRLDSLYTIQKDWLNLRATLESLARLTDGEEQITVKYRLGRLFATELGESQKAVGIYEEILKICKGHSGAVSALEELVYAEEAALEAFNVVLPELEKMNEWERCYLLLEKMVEREEMPVQRVEYLRKMARIAEEKLEASGRAFECMGLAFKTIPEDKSVLNELERLASDYRMWEDLVPMLLDGAKIVEGSELSLSLRLKAAQLLREKIGDPDSAIREYMAITADYPGNWAALNALDSLYTEKGAYGDLAKIVEMQIEITAGKEEKIQQFLRLGSLCENNLKETDRALKAYKEIIYLTGGDARGVANLRRLYNSGFRREEILEILGPIYHEKGAFEDLIDLYEMRLEDMEERADRLSYTLKIAELFEKKLNDKYKAFEWFGKGLVLSPSDELLLSVVEELALSVEKQRELMEVLLEAAKESDVSDRKIMLWHKAADISLNTLKEKTRAENIYKWILQLKGDDLPALKALDAMYLADGRYLDLVDILRREIEATPFEDDRLVLYMRAGNVMLDWLGDEKGAEEAFKSALSINETHREALDKLEGIYEKRGDFSSLYSIYERKLDISQDLAERISLMHRMAVIAVKSLSQRDLAVELYEEILRNRSSDTVAMRELQRLYSEKGDWDSFIRICEHELDYTGDDVERKLSLLKQVARAEEEFIGDAYRSQLTWKKVLDVEPYDLDALFALRRLFRETEDFESLINILDRLTEKEKEPEELRSLIEESAVIFTDVVSKPDRAIEQWLKVLQFEPNYMKAILSLERLYEDTGRYSECVEMMKRHASLEQGEASAEILTRAGDILSENLKDIPGACELYEKALSLKPGSLDLHGRLENLYYQLQDFGRLATLLLNRVEIFKERLDKLIVLHDLARIYEEKLMNLDGAFLVLVKAAELAPGDVSTFSELFRIVQLKGNYEEYLAVIDSLQPRMEEEMAVEHLLRAGEIAAFKLNNYPEGIRYFERCLSIQGENEIALSKLAELYEKTSRWEDLVKVLGKMAENASDQMDRLRYYLKSGEVYEKKLKNLQLAIEAYNEALSIDETDMTVLDSLERLYGAQKDYESLINILRKKADARPENEGAINLKIGMILEEKIGSPKRAIDHYEAMLRFDPANLEALGRLEILYGERNDWEKLVEVYERLFETVEKPEDRIRMAKNLAILHEETLNEPLLAIEDLQKILDIDSSNAYAVENLERLYTKLEQWNELINLYEQQASVREEKAEILGKVAEEYEKRLNDIDAAISTYKRILEIKPAVFAFEALVRLYVQGEQWEDAVSLLLQRAGMVEEPDSILMRAAEILYRKVESPVRALKVLEKARGDAARNFRREIFISLSEWESVIETYREEEASTSGEEQKADILTEIGDIYSERLCNIGKGIEYYEKALFHSPRHIRASMALADKYVQMKKWEKAEPLLEMLLKSKEIVSDPVKASELHYLAGLSAENLLDYDMAFREYQTAIKLSPEHLKTAYGLARLYFKKEYYQLSKDNYIKILDSHKERLSDDDLEQIYCALGEISLRLNQLDHARNYFEKTLEINPTNVWALEQLHAEAQRRNDLQGVVKYKYEIVKLKADPFEKFAILLDIADIYKEKMKNSYGAVAAIKDALTYDPASKIALLKLFNIYFELEHTEDAIGVLERLAKVEENREKKALHYLRIAAIYMEQLKNDFKAVEFFNLALDTDYEKLEAFRAIDEILTRHKDWEALARNYRLMIDRVKGKGFDDLEFNLYFNLGEVYRSRLKKPHEAVEMFTIAEKFRPSDRKTHEILVNLYEVELDEKDKAVIELKKLVEVDPLNRDMISYYRALKRLYLETKDFDRAHNTAGILVALNLANEDEERFYMENIEPELPEFTGSLDAFDYETSVFSREEDLLVGHIFQTLYLGVGSELEVKEPKQVGLKKKNEMNLEQKLLFISVYNAVKAAMGVLPHKLYKDDGMIGMKIENTMPPSFIIGPDMLTGKEERELGFYIGRELSSLHPMHILPAVKDLNELKILFVGALKFAIPDFPITAGIELVAEIVKTIEKKMSQSMKNTLKTLVLEFKGRKEDADLGRQLKGIELSGKRCGLLMSGGDIETAIRIISGEDDRKSILLTEQRLEDLIRYSLSDEYYAARKKLGITVTI